jgi:hypothetical protein
MISTATRPDKLRPLKSTQNLYRLAVLLWNGDGMPKSYKRGFSAALEAAHLGHVKAQVMVGAAYDYGVGVRRNPELAFRYYKRAALAGDFDAQYDVGACYAEGVGVRANNRAAVRWLTLAAKHGVPDALRVGLQLSIRCWRKERFETGFQITHGGCSAGTREGAILGWLLLQPGRRCESRPNEGVHMVPFGSSTWPSRGSI